MREIFNLNEKWAFSKEAMKPPVAMPQNWYWVNLPHTWNAIDGQDGGNDTTVELVFMRKKSERGTSGGRTVLSGISGSECIC